MFRSKKLAVAATVAVLSGIVVGLMCASAMAVFEWAQGAI